MKTFQVEIKLKRKIQAMTKAGAEVLVVQDADSLRKSFPGDAVSVGGAVPVDVKSDKPMKGKAKRASNTEDNNAKGVKESTTSAKTAEKKVAKKAAKAAAPKTEDRRKTKAKAKASGKAKTAKNTAAKAPKASAPKAATTEKKKVGRPAGSKNKVKAAA